MVLILFAKIQLFSETIINTLYLIYIISQLQGFNLCGNHWVRGLPFCTFNSKAQWAFGKNCNFVAVISFKQSRNTCHYIIDTTKQLTQWIEERLPETKPSTP